LAYIGKEGTNQPESATNVMVTHEHSFGFLPPSPPSLLLLLREFALESVRMDLRRGLSATFGLHKPWNFDLEYYHDLIQTYDR